MTLLCRLIVDSSATDHGRNRRGADRGFQCHTWKKSGKSSAGPGSRSLWRYFWRVGVWMGFCAFFRAPPRRLELSASFSSARALTPVSARGLLVISSQLLSGSFMCGQTHMFVSKTTTTIIQSGVAPFLQASSLHPTLRS